MARDPVLFGLLAWRAREASQTSTIAASGDGETVAAATAEMPALGAGMVLVTFVWRMEAPTMAELKFTSKESGAPYVTISGTSMMLTWCVGSLATPMRPALLGGQRMARV